MTRFKTIGLITRPDDTRLTDTVRTLLEYLQGKELEVVVDQTAANLLRDTGLMSQRREAIAQRCDLAIVVGGDGTLLYAARSLLHDGVPLLGINQGRLGFLVDITPDEMTERLDEILAGRYHEDRRLLLHGQVLREGKIIASSDAFNDIVVHVRELVRMIEFDTYINTRYLNTQRADGLIVSTPTGSTAYALSGGGPIVHPDLETIVLVPICPHTLSNRPIVIDADSQIEVVLGPNNTVPAMASFDGQENIDLNTGDRIQITRQSRTLRLIQPQDHDYFQLLRAKLRWSEQP
jgi:NAD+ kinase